MFTFCRFGDDLRVRATHFVAASQPGLRADGAAIDRSSISTLARRARSLGIVLGSCKSSLGSASELLD